jgi:hypothetical protein
MPEHRPLLAWLAEETALFRSNSGDTLNSGEPAAGLARRFAVVRVCSPGFAAVVTQLNTYCASMRTTGSWVAGVICPGQADVSGLEWSPAAATVAVLLCCATSTPRATNALLYGSSVVTECHHGAAAVTVRGRYG